MPATSTTDKAEPPASVLEFDMYAAPPPRRDWEYALDNTGIVHRRGMVARRLRPGWWPFAYEDRDREHLFRRRIGPPVPVECGVATVRLAPDCAVYAWGNEYVHVRPSHTVPHHAEASLTLWVRPHGLGGVVTHCDVHLDLLANTYRIEGLNAAVHDDVTKQAEMKAAKLSAYLAAEVKNRDGDRRRPVTVADRVQERRERPGQWEEPDPRNGKPGWTRDVGDGDRHLMVVEVADGWRWAVCPYDRTEILARGTADDGGTAMAQADAAATGSQSRTG